jgi:transketolase
MTDMRTAFVTAAEELLDSDPLSAVVLAEISADLFAKAAARHPDRVLNVGIREQLMVSVGGGLALAGLRPIVHTYAPFLVSRAYEQVKLDLGHQDAHAVLVSVGASFDTARGGRTHQAPEDVALLGTVPGFAIHVPGHPDEIPALLTGAVAALSAPGGHSSYIRLSVMANREPFGGDAIPASGSGSLRLIRQGSRALVIAVGPMLDPVLQAAHDLAVTVAYTSTIRPFDAAGLRSLVDSAATDTVILVEPYLAGTSASVVSEALATRPHKLLSLGVPRIELRRYGTPEDHARLYGLDASGIRRSITEFLV